MFNNFITIVNIFLSIVHVIIVWKEIRNELNIRNKENYNYKYVFKKLIFFSFFVLMYTIVALVYLLVKKMLLGRSEFNKYYFEEDTNTFYILYFIGFALYSALNLGLLIDITYNLIKIKRLILQTSFDYQITSKTSDQASSLGSSNNIDILDSTYKSSKEDNSIVDGGDK